MSKKETKAERREAARQVRIEAQRKRQRARRLRQITIYSVVIVAVVALAAFGVTRYVQGRQSLAEAITEADCSQIQEFPSEGQEHIASLEQEVQYKTNPPTSGNHFGNPADWGVYPDTVDPRILVHNLEHGGSVIHYNDISEEDIEKLEDLVDNEFPEGAILNPNPDIDHPLAMAAWRATQTCERVSVEVVRGFVKARCNKTHEPLAKC